jgi:hypothetical protein
MKIPKIADGVMLVMLLLVCASPHSEARKSEQSSTPASAQSVDAFQGRWDLTLKAPDHEYPSWLELSQDGGQLKAVMVARWGHARQLPKVELSNGKLTFVSPKEEEASPSDMIFQGTLVGKTLSGTVNGPDGKTWQWTGQRAPALQRSGVPKWGKPIPLFNGKDLSGWKMENPGTAVWKVENGLLITPGNGRELISNSKFEDFKLHVEFKADPDSNSGVYLRGRYEVQVETDSLDEPPSHRIAGVYGFLAPMPAQPRKPGEWQTFDITLIGRHVIVVQNGQTVIDNKEIPGLTGGALDSHEELPGPIYLQGSEKGRVAFRNIVITPAEK